MNLLDWIIIVWLALAFVVGIQAGLIYRLGHLIGLMVGIYLAGKYYDVVAGWFGSSPWSKFIVFQFILSGISMLGGYAAVLFNKVFSFVSWMPFLKTANRFLGGVFGVLTQAMIISVVLYFVSKINISIVVTQTVQESQLADIFLLLGRVVAVLLPRDLTSLKSLF